MITRDSDDIIIQRYQIDITNKNNFPEAEISQKSENKISLKPV